MPIGTLKSSFRSLSSPLYRAYFVGMAFSRTGNWMQDVTQGWLVFERTGSATAVGALLAAEYLPLLFLGPFGGAIVDRHSRRNLLMITQIIFALLAFALAGVTAIEAPLFTVYIVAVLRGLLATVNLPASSAFVSEVVAPANMRSAVSLNGLLFNLGRIIGPLLATLVVAVSSISVCFVVNGFSFLVLLVALFRVRTVDVDLHLRQSPSQSLQTQPPQTGSPTSSQRSGNSGVREGLRYAWSVPELRACLVIMAGVGTFIYNSQVFFPLLARDIYRGGINTYAHLMALLSLGFIAASLFSASGRPPSNRQLLQSTAMFAVMVTLEAAVADLHWLGMIVIVAWGAASGVFASHINTTIQLTSAPELKGRVMALWNMVTWGTTPLGAPIVGWIGERYDPRVSLVFAATMTLACLGYATWHLRHRLDECPIS